MEGAPPLLSAQQLTLRSGPNTTFGSGAIRELAATVTSLSHTRALLVTDPGVLASGIVDDIERALHAAGVETCIYGGVHPNPGMETLNAGAQAAREWGRAVVVAVGGGSVLDSAKGIALMAVNEGSARDFDYRNQPAHPGLPLVAVPTTAGTGAETNAFGVIDDEDAGRKFYVGHASVLPRAVILDPELTRALPPAATAATGMDVLTHALESLSSVGTNPYAEGINLQVVRMVVQFLPRAVSDGHDLEARAQMLLAAHMAGLAFATTGLGLGHAVAHALSARVGVPHGVALAVLLPHVLAFNAPVRTEMYARAAWALGVADARRDDGVNADAARDRIRHLAEEVGMPGTLRELGCDDSIIPAVVEDALRDEVIANTPHPPTASELETLLRAAI